MSELFTQGHACIIGVGGDLPNTVDDAIGFAKILQDPERCAYPVEQVSLLTKEEAKRDNILAALDRLAQSTTPDATVIVYFSGHGYQVSSSMGTAYYLMAFGYDQNQLYSTAISGTEFATKLQTIPAKKLLVLLDCCHAGGLDDTQKIGLTAEKAPLPPEAQALLAEGKGRVFIASSKADEKSLAGKPYSAFTLALIESLAGKGASQQDGYVRVADVALYAREVVPKWTGNRQHPILNFEQADNFVLAYYAGGEMEPKGLPFAGEPEIESEAGEFNRQIINHTEVIASGQGAVAIGGNAQGATIVTGDGNVVGNKTVNQRGKYNINIDRAENMTIGDKYGVVGQSGAISRGGKPSNPFTKSPSNSIDPKAEQSEKGIKVKPQDSRVEVPVFFATDRQHLDTRSVKTYYGGKRNPSSQLEYGIAKVSIPEDHRMGEIERPKWWKLELWEDPDKHVVLMDIDTFDRNSFVNTLRQSVANSKASDLLLFIHGYNTSFEDAAIRTAQIAYDLQFPGQTILYSWPSEAKLPLYTADENNIDWTLPHFEDFLNLLLTSVGADMVNTIAHSMGNRIMVRALDRLNYSTLPEHAAKLRNVIFAAPDIDAATFKQFVKQFKQKADRLTLYASSNDKALKASMSVHGGYPRAGIAGADITIVDGLDTIDASDVDTSFMGHSYFGDNRSIISDIFYLIKHGFSPNDRSGLKPKTIQNLGYWFFQP
jgi:esterase/lipase superfamily enzyme